MHFFPSVRQSCPCSPSQPTRDISLEDIFPYLKHIYSLFHAKNINHRSCVMTERKKSPPQTKLSPRVVQFLTRFLYFIELKLDSQNNLGRKE